jgi:hypothetical protein
MGIERHGIKHLDDAHAFFGQNAQLLCGHWAYHYLLAEGTLKEPGCRLLGSPER